MHFVPPWPLAVQIIVFLNYFVENQGMKRSKTVYQLSWINNTNIHVYIYMYNSFKHYTVLTASNCVLWLMCNISPTRQTRSSQGEIVSSEIRPALSPGDLANREQLSNKPFKQPKTTSSYHHQELTYDIYWLPSSYNPYNPTKKTDQIEDSFQMFMSCNTATVSNSETKCNGAMRPTTWEVFGKSTGISGPGHDRTYELYISDLYINENI